MSDSNLTDYDIGLQIRENIWTAIDDGDITLVEKGNVYLNYTPPPQCNFILISPGAETNTFPSVGNTQATVNAINIDIMSFIVDVENTWKDVAVLWKEFKPALQKIANRIADGMDFNYPVIPYNFYADKTGDMFFSGKRVLATYNNGFDDTVEHY